MQYAQPEVRVQTMNAFQVIIIHPEYLQVHLHVVNAECWSLLKHLHGQDCSMPQLSRALGKEMV